MKRLLLVLCCLFTCAGSAGGAFEFDDSEAALPVGPAGLGGNPAPLASVQCWRWRTDHSQPFGLAQLASTGAALAVGRGSAGLGLGLRTTGFSLHREVSAWLAAAVALPAVVDLGVAVTYAELRQPGWRHRQLGVIPGARLELGSGLQLDIWYQRGDSVVPGKLFLGLHHHLDTTSVTRLHLRHSTTLATRADLAAEQQLHPRLRLLVGLRTHPRRFTLGAVVRAGRRFVSFAGITHPYLGSSRMVTAGNTCSAP